MKNCNNILNLEKYCEDICNYRLDCKNCKLLIESRENKFNMINFITNNISNNSSISTSYTSEVKFNPDDYSFISVSDHKKDLFRIKNYYFKNVIGFFNSISSSNTSDFYMDRLNNIGVLLRDEGNNEVSIPINNIDGVYSYSILNRYCKNFCIFCSCDQCIIGKFIKKYEKI